MTHMMPIMSIRFRIADGHGGYERRWYCQAHQRWEVRRYDTERDADMAPQTIECLVRQQSVPEAQREWMQPS